MSRPDAEAEDRALRDAENLQDFAEDYCGQCERVRTETCPACGDEDPLHAA
jgi:hypothetical protein